MASQRQVDLKSGPGGGRGRRLSLKPFRSIRKDGIFRPEYDGLYARNGGKGTKALVAVMRSALRLMYAVALDGFVRH